MNVESTSMERLKFRLLMEIAQWLKSWRKFNFQQFYDWYLLRKRYDKLAHGVPDFEFGRKKLSPQATTDSDTVFHEESIGEGFKIVTVAVFEKILLFEKKKIGLSLTAIFKPTRVVTKFLVK